MAIKVFNTLTRKKEDFIPRDPGKVSIYACGPTTYNYIHLGNARPLVVFDTIRRYFKYRGYEVTFIQNFTDVDDKIINRAQDEGKAPEEIAEKYIKAYFQDADALHVLRADVHPKVTEHINEIINMVEGIIERGLAYHIKGNVYFDVRKFKGYGRLSGRDLDELKSGARVGVDEEKKDPLDFALWKAAKPGEPSWSSPWGAGRPGWHIECSAMSYKYLGAGFDIHGGGADLVFPHHENEIAQTEAYTGEPFVRYWLHNGFITVNEEKMSKSLGNFFMVRDILAKFSPDVVRFYLLSTHYRSPLDFDDQKLQVAEKSLERMHTAYRLAETTLDLAKKTAAPGKSKKEKIHSEKLAQMKTDFIAAMDDDFNTSLALATVFDFCREVNSFINDPDFQPGAVTIPYLEEILKIFDEFHQVLGMVKPATDLSRDESGLVDRLMDIIINIRQEARKNKDWATADAIRDNLKDIGVLMEDTPHGVRWKKIDDSHE